MVRCNMKNKNSILKLEKFLKLQFVGKSISHFGIDIIPLDLWLRKPPYSRKYHIDIKIADSQIDILDELFKPVIQNSKAVGVDEELYFHLTWSEDYDFNHEFFRACYSKIADKLLKYYGIEVEYINFNPEVF